MEINQKNLNRILKIEDLSKRKAKLQELCLSIGHHGGVWKNAMQELDKLNEMNIKTALEKKFTNT